MENAIHKIIVNPDIAFGKPTIRGLRYSAQWLLELLSSGMTVQEILKDYADLELEDIRAVLDFSRVSEEKLDWKKFESGEEKIIRSAKTFSSRRSGKQARF